MVTTSPTVSGLDTNLTVPNKCSIRPEGRTLPRAGDLHPGTLRELDKRREADAQRITELQEGTDARVRGALLDVDEHAAADAGDTGEGVEGPATCLALVAHAFTDAGCQRGRGIIMRCGIMHLRLLPWVPSRRGCRRTSPVSIFGPVTPIDLDW